MRRWTTGIGILALTACAEQPIGLVSTPGVQVAPDLALVMPSPADLGRRIEVVQLVVARYGDRTLTFEARISAAPDRFDLVCLDPLGRKAMSIHWTPGDIQTEKAAWVPEDLRPENMLADIVMLYWPGDVVRRALLASGGTMSVDSQTRSIRAHGAESIHIEFQPSASNDPWNGRVGYRNLPWNYALDIQSRVIGP